MTGPNKTEVSKRDLAWMALQVLGEMDQEESDHTEPAPYNVEHGWKLIQNPIPFTLMVAVHILFKVKHSEVKTFDDTFLAMQLLNNEVRVDLHKAVVQMDEKDPKSDRVIQYDVEMETSDLSNFVDNCQSIASHHKFDSIWKQAGAEIREENEADCHVKAFEPHGCKCQKHIKAWTQKLVLLRCNTCTPGLKEEMIQASGTRSTSCKPM